MADAPQADAMGRALDAAVQRAMGRGLDSGEIRQLSESMSEVRRLQSSLLHHLHAELMRVVEAAPTPQRPRPTRQHGYAAHGPGAHCRTRMPSSQSLNASEQRHGYGVRPLANMPSF